VHHFDSKAEVEIYAREKGIPATFFMAGAFMTNFVGILEMMSFDKDEGAWKISMPVGEEVVLPLFDTGDTGKFVKGAVLNWEAVVGKRLYGATEYMSGREMVDGFKRVFPEAGRGARYVKLGEEEYKEGLRKAGMEEWVVRELMESLGRGWRRRMRCWRIG
jgi:uncharacterized protein YbjT (DUF2867 family)